MVMQPSRPSVDTDVKGHEFLTGTLAAIVYTDANVSMELSGAFMGSSSAGGFQIVTTGSGPFESGTGSFVAIADTGTNFEFVAQIVSGSTKTPVTFNFNESDSRYIRKVFNTNPQKTNAAVVAGATTNYFLGETFDRHMKANLTNGKRTCASFVRIYNEDDSLGGSDYKGTDVQSMFQPISFLFTR